MSPHPAEKALVLIGLSYLGLFTGYIVRTAWFPGEPGSTYAFGGTCADPCTDYFSTGSVHIGLDHLIAIGLILAVWVFNFFGTRVAVSFNYLAGILLMFPLFCFTLLPFINADFTTDNLTYKLNDGLPWGACRSGLGDDSRSGPRHSPPSTRTPGATRDGL